MKRLAPLIVLAAAQCSPVPATSLEVEGNTFKLSTAEAENCNTKGGCVLISIRALEEELVKAAQKGYALATKTCKKDTHI